MGLVELEYYIHLAKRLGYLDEDDHRRLDALQDETARVLTGFIRFNKKQKPRLLSALHLVSRVPKPMNFYIDIVSLHIRIYFTFQFTSFSSLLP